MCFCLQGDAPLSLFRVGVLHLSAGGLNRLSVHLNIKDIYFNHIASYLLLYLSRIHILLRYLAARMLLLMAESSSSNSSSSSSSSSSTEELQQLEEGLAADMQQLHNSRAEYLFSSEETPTITHQIRWEQVIQLASQLAS